MKKLLLSLFCLSSSLSINANYSFKLDGIYYSTLGNNTVAVSSPYGNAAKDNEKIYSGNVNIPKTVTYNSTSYTVTTIDSYAFYFCKNLTKVNIPNTIKTIRNNAFAECTGLTSITIPNSVTFIGNEAFSKCTGLSSIIIPNSVTYLSGFNYCSGLKSVTIPNSVKTIGNGAFAHCTGLESVSIPNSVKKIENLAFIDCAGITTFSIPSSVTSIGDHAFSHCSGVRSYSIPNSVTDIGQYAFSENENLNSIELPNSLNKISNYTFNNCKSLKSFTLPDSVKSIGNSAFSGCTQLTSFTFNNTVTSIGDYAFEKCTSLASIIIPNSVTTIGHQAFNRCGIINSVTIGNSVSSLGKYPFDGTSVKNLIYADGCTTTIATGLNNIESVTLPNSLKSLDWEAFSNCNNLNNVKISLRNQEDFMNYIARKDIKYIFYEYYYSYPDKCDLLNKKHIIIIDGEEQTSITIPANVSYIDSYAFYNCSDIKKLIYADGCGTALATGLTCATDVSIPSSVKNIESQAFKDFTDLTSLNLPAYVDTIGNKAFSGCTSLTSLVIPASTKSIGNNAFSGCENLKKIEFGDLITNIGSNVFNNCPAILYTNKGSYTLLSLWNYDKIPYELGTEQLLSKPNIIVSATQTTATVKVQNEDYKEYTYYNDDEVLETNEYTIYGLNPEQTYSVTIYICKTNNDKAVTCRLQKDYITKNISPTISCSSTASSIHANGTYIHGDAVVAEEHISIGGYNHLQSNNEVDSTGLDPNESYTLYYTIRLQNGKEYYSYKDIKTLSLLLATQQPKVIDDGNVIVQAISNLDNTETNVGFEWRRTDWTDEFASNTGTGYLYKGTMEGYIRNLPEGFLWKYRPYYTSNSGMKYYGDWVGIDPLNTSYFEPTVHTYDYINVNSNKATVRGFAQRGTDDIVEQGFKYWRGNSTSAKSNVKYAMSIPDNAKTIAVPTYNNNPIMVTTLTGLDYNAEYHVVAFITTSESSFYGVEQIFTTGDDPTGIESVKTDTGSHSYTAGIYDLNGRKLDSPQRGVNIIRFEDGTVKKILMK